MIDERDHIEAIFLTARHGRDAPHVAGAHGSRAADRGDVNEARRWRAIGRFIRRTIGTSSAIPAKSR